ncbi:MAG: hypothetical protein AMJ81_02735 [Phycisphaerae bacterium SM23_33]|nr:MAG: hypothetical protein AMJ81_02735 [Phycisphaerae bacterium SM23_33]
MSTQAACLCFSGLDKSRITRRYVRAVPHFPEKPFGLAVWKDYLNAEAAKLAGPPRSLEEHLAFLQAARQVVEQNNVRALR